MPNNTSQVEWKKNKRIFARFLVFFSVALALALVLHLKICSPMCVVCSFISVKNNTLVRFLRNLKRWNRWSTCCEAVRWYQMEKWFQSLHVFVCVFFLSLLGEIQIKLRQEKSSHKKEKNHFFLPFFCSSWHFTYRRRWIIRIVCCFQNIRKFAFGTNQVDFFIPIQWICIHFSDFCLNQKLLASSFHWLNLGF